jgi:hypothetical protein
MVLPKLESGRTSLAIENGSIDLGTSVRLGDADGNNTSLFNVVTMRTTIDLVARNAISSGRGTCRRLATVN